MVTQSDLQQFKQRAGASLLALKRLQELDLSACAKLTDSSITQVVEPAALVPESFFLLHLFV